MKINFNELSSREKWDSYKNTRGTWRCGYCDAILEDGPNRASPFSGCSIHCNNCEGELTRRTGGGQNDPFRWVLA